MPSPTTIKSQCNTLVNGNVLTRITAHCSVIFNNRSNYPQLLSTHTEENIPHHTTTASDNRVPDNLNNLPPLETTKWNDIITEFLATALPCAFSLTPYGSETERGYELVMRFFHNDRLFVRVLNAGPQSYREHDWREEPLTP